MAVLTNRLSARRVVSEKKPGRHADGGGLYLIVDPSGAKRWLFMFRWHGKLKEMGLGGINAVSLADARQRAAEARRTVKEGKNPIDARRAARALLSEKTTFGAFADELVAELSKGFRNEKHAAQWEMTLKVYAAPLRSKQLSEITTDDVLSVLKKIWTEKPETASRLRGRIERILDAAKAKGLRAGENPARWRGHLANLLPRQSAISRKHYSAMRYAELPDFFAELQKSDLTSSLALQFTILTVSRTSEVILAQSAEIVAEGDLWIVPATRMKAGREHRIPLLEQTNQILKKAGWRKDGGYIFAGRRPERPLSNMAMAQLLDRLKRSDVTVHGFRSAFRDWVSEATDFPGEIAEMCLAHVVGSEVERAYRRGDVLEKRRQLLTAWANYCTGGANATAS